MESNLARRRRRVPGFEGSGMLETTTGMEAGRWEGDVQLLTDGGGGASRPPWRTVVAIRGTVVVAMSGLRGDFALPLPTSTLNLSLVIYFLGMCPTVSAVNCSHEILPSC